MNRKAKVTALAALICLAAGWPFAGFAGDKEVVFDETFPVRAGGKLKVNVGDMDIDLRSGGSEEARVEVTVTGSVDKMRKRFEKMNFTAELEGNTLVISAEERGSWSVLWFGHGRGGIHLSVTLPRQFDVDAQTSDGDITADRLDGETELKTSDGDIVVAWGAGGLFDLKTSDGDISVDEVAADDVYLRTSDGDITVQSLKGRSVTVKTSDGDVAVDKMQGGSMSVGSSDGDLELTVSAGELRAKTSDGDIAVRVEDRVALDLSTSDGDITIRLPKHYGAVLDLKGEHVTLGGKVELEGEVSKKRISGTLQDGGPKLRARTSDGSVALRFD
jgi:hypothetical protein